MKAPHLMKSIWTKKLPPSAFKKTRVVSELDNERRQSPPMPTDHSSHLADGSQQPLSSFEDGPVSLDIAENLAEAMPLATKSSSTTGSSSATEASLAPPASSTATFLRPLDRPWKRVYENLRIMKLGEPGRLALLASTYSSAESRSRLTKPGEPEMSWEEVKAAVRESPPLKRKFNSDGEETKEPPRHAKLSRFEERTAGVNVYALPKNPNTTYHPTKPRLKHAFPTEDEEELHLQKKRRCDGPPSIFGPSRTPPTGDAISPILRPIKLLPFDAKGDSVPKPEVESSLAPAKAVASAISVPIKKSRLSVPKVQIPRSPPRAPAATSTIEPSSLESLRAQARKHLRLARHRARRSKDKRLVKAMKESRRQAKELGPIKHTGTRPPPSISNDDSHNDDRNKGVRSPPDCMEAQIEPSHTTIEKIIQNGNEARRRAGFWTAEKEVVQPQREEIKKEDEVQVKVRKRFLRHLPEKESPLKTESESELES